MTSLGPTSPIRVAFALTSLVGALAAAGLDAQDVTFHGQVRPRMEIRNLGGDSETTVFTSMRVRADLQAALERGVEVFVQLQDVRLWGEETSTLADFSADNLDLHQGYVAVNFGSDPSDLQARIALGRQETNFGGQRLVGSVGWAPQGRSFDGARVSALSGSGRVDVVAYKLREEAASADSESDLFGAYGILKTGDYGALDVYVLYDRVAATTETERATFGTRFSGSAGLFSYRAEISLQRGTVGGLDTEAYMLGARLGRAFHEGRGSVTLWFDVLSGDDDPTDGMVKVFNTLFATNHKFYGLADLFLNVPAHTGGLGLRDFAVKSSYLIGDGLRVAVDLHHFETASRGSLESSALGQELDVTLSYPFSSNLGISAGHSFVLADDALAVLGRANGDVHFGYLMVDARF